MAHLQLQQLTKWFGRVPVLKSIDLEVADRELFVLVGPSGCGKTTLLRLIAGLEEPTEGKIYIDKRLVLHDTPKDRNIAMVFQNYSLYPHMTVFENMSFGLRMRGYSDDEITHRVGEAAGMLGLSDYMDRRPQEISGGQRQRVAVGRALVRKPKLFLFDEPFSNLDAQLRAQTRAELLALHQRLQATMIYVTHDQVEAMTLGDRIGVLHEGILQQVGRPLDLYRRPKNRFVAQFIGSPSMNFFNVTVIHRGESSWLDQGHFQLRLPDHLKRKSPLKDGQEILLGIRPEDIHDRLFEPGRAAEGNSVIALVQLIEPVGSETHVHLDVGGTRFVSCVEASNPLKLNQPMEVIFNLDKVHLFTRDGRERLMD